VEIRVLGQVKPIEPEELKKLIERLVSNPELIYSIKELHIVNEKTRWVVGQYVSIKHSELLGFEVAVEKDKDVAELKLMYSTAIVEVRCVSNDCFVNVESLISCTCGEQV